MVVALNYGTIAGAHRFGTNIQPYIFCYPNVSGYPFFIGFEANVPQKYDSIVLNHILVGKARYAKAIKETTCPNGLSQVGRYYDITAAMPPYVCQKLGTRDPIPGPNCYHVIMATYYGDRFTGRYVHDEEMEYYLTRDFEPTADRNMFGAVLIYGIPHRRVLSPLGFDAGSGDTPANRVELSGMKMGKLGEFVMEISGMQGPSHISRRLGAFQGHAITDEMIASRESMNGEGEHVSSSLSAIPVESPKIIQTMSPGVHGAIMLFGGMIFQKGGYADHHLYRIVPAGKAMSSIEVKQERFASKKEPEDDSQYKYTSYVKTDRDPVERFRVNSELTAELLNFKILLEHYLERFRDVKDKSWSDFTDNRIDLLSVENMWQLLRDIEKVMRSYEPTVMTALLRTDSQIAEQFLELQSLRWQYQVMTDRFAPFLGNWARSKVEEKLRELYRDHYVHPDSTVFRNEIVTHLKMRGVERSRWHEIAEAVIEQVKTYDPIAFATSNGARGIPFAEILNELIR